MSKQEIAWIRPESHYIVISLLKLEGECLHVPTFSSLPVCVQLCSPFLSPTNSMIAAHVTKQPFEMRI